MSIQIEQLNVKNLGPLNDFSSTFSQINLFYGHNEHGKTYLVEFMYNCLFKNKALSLRDVSASGQVLVSGLEKKETLFSPSIRKKLEDFWEDDLPGLPRDFSKLLVVKGADLDLSPGNQAGIDDRILKEFLSGEGLLETISKVISKTESSATYENGRLSGSNTGNIRKYRESQALIEQIDEAFQSINMNISGGKRYELKQKINDLEKQRIEQERARQHLAFNLANQVAILKSQMDELPPELINAIDRSIGKHQQKQATIEKKQQELEKNREKSKEYPWLESAIAEYRTLILAGGSFKIKSGIIWLIFTLISIALAVTLVLIRQPYFGVGLIGLALVFAFIYLRGLIKRHSNVTQREELEKIAKGYKDRFGGSEVVQEATLVAKQKELGQTYFTIEPLTKEIQALTGELNNLEQEIKSDLKKLPNIKKTEWLDIINILNEKRKKLEEQFHKRENELSSLNVNENDYLQEDVSVEYNRDHLKTISEELVSSQNDLEEAENVLNELKQGICGITGKTISCAWEGLVEALTDKREEEVKKYKSITASILAQIEVNRVLDDLRAVEAERIEEGLGSTTLSQALLATTGHYDRVEKEDGVLFVADSFGRYPVSELSTGAREQVLLGLRIGFAARILAGKPLFLILDDAFQHSDWERREWLVSKLFTLVNEGWQIIYFTMDDHIRKLFETNAKKANKDQYQTIILP